MQTPIFLHSPKPRRLPATPVLVHLLAALLLPAALAAQAWVPKGPSPGVGEFNTLVYPNQPVGGALEAVVAHPTNPNILWVGSVGGGIFRTDNATSASPSWTSQTGGQSSLAISALELDPSDGSHNTLLAGIGKRSSFFSGTTDGAPLRGLLKTTNGGATWASLSPSLIGSDVSGLAPRGSTVVASVDGPGSSCSTVGIWRSTNGGTNFTQISNTGLPCGFARDLASDPTNSARLFAPISGTPGATDDGLYVSTNTGATWSEVGAGSVMDNALQGPSVEVQVAVGRESGSATNLFVAVCDGTSKLSGLFYSPNAGATWSSLDLPTTNESGTSFGIHPGGQCTIHLSLAADPVDHSVVYIGGDRQPAANEGAGGGSLPNSIGSSSFAGRIFKVDADLPSGSQAVPITNCPTALPGCGGSRRTVNNTAPHADSREMVFDAGGHLIQTDDGGVYRHTDPRGINGDWQSVVGNLAAIEQHSAAYDTNADILFSGNQDNGTLAQISPGSAVWEQRRGGDGGDVAVALNDPVAGQSRRYISSQNLGGLRRQVYDANNNFLGETFPSLTPINMSPPIGVLFVTPLVVNRVNPAWVVVSGGNGMYESFDRLDTITRVSLSAANPQGRGPIAYGASGNPGALHFGVLNAVQSRIPPFAVTPTFPGGSTDPDPITGVVMDPDDADGSTVFAVSTDSVYGTTDPLFLGWANVTGNLFSANPTAGEINAVAYVNQGGDRLVVGTNSGIFVAPVISFNTSATWTPLGTGLPNVPIYDLQYDPENNLLAAGTMGRGSWTLSLDGTCPWERLFAGSTLNTPQTQKAEGFIYLGPDLTVSNGTGINMSAGQGLVISEDVTIGGTFSAILGPCP